MSVVISEISFDCQNPMLLARFWCEALGFIVLEEQVGLVTIGPDEKDARRPVLTFAQVPEEKRAKNRVHLDLRPTGNSQQDEVKRLLRLGANYADVGQDQDETWVVMADPEGNEFCVLSGTM